MLPKSLLHGMGSSMGIVPSSGNELLQWRACRLLHEHENAPHDVRDGDSERVWECSPGFNPRLSRAVNELLGVSDWRAKEGGRISAFAS